MSTHNPVKTGSVKGPGEGSGSASGFEPTARPVSGDTPRAHTADMDPPASTWKGYLEMRLGNGPVARRLLTESSVVIGRIPNVQLQLDHHTVSRRHAEMFCDPFGRWWIRDLNSTNGTLVNDEPVT